MSGRSSPIFLDFYQALTRMTHQTLQYTQPKQTANVIMQAGSDITTFQGQAQFTSAGMRIRLAALRGGTLHPINLYKPQ